VCSFVHLLNLFNCCLSSYEAVILEDVEDVDRVNVSCLDVFDVPCGKNSVLILTLENDE